MDNLLMALQENASLVQGGLLLVSLAVLILLFVLIFRGRDTAPNAAEQEAKARQEQALAHLIQAQAELSGRMAQLSEGQAANQARLGQSLQNQERAVSETLEKRLDHMGQRVGEAMRNLHERLAVIDSAQKNITQLSGQVSGLREVLSNKQARGAFGEVQLENLVREVLPPSAFDFQVTLSNGKRADCLLRLPNPPGPIVVDSKFPLESYRAMREATDDSTRTQAARAFSQDVKKHVKDIAERYIQPGETSDQALMFLPSEAIYAELHANFANLVEEGYRARVWIVSPTTMMATLNTVRAVLKDAHMREMADVIQSEVRKLFDDVGRLTDRVDALDKHFQTATKDIAQIQTSAGKITRRAERIGELELGEQTARLSAE